MGYRFAAAVDWSEPTPDERGSGSRVVCSDNLTRSAQAITRNLLTVLSLVLCVATVTLWLRSYRVRDLVTYSRVGGNGHVAQSILGRLHVLSNLGGSSSGGASYRADRLSPQAVWSGGMSSYPNHVQWRLGFVWQTYSRTHMGMGQAYTTANRLVVVPYWFPAGIFALAPLGWMAASRLGHEPAYDVMIDPSTEQASRSRSQNRCGRPRVFVS